VGNGNIDVGNTTPTRGPGQPIVESLAEADSPRRLPTDRANALKSERPRERPRERPSVCGAMSQQQRGYSGHDSVPQEFVRLVGCCDSKVRPEPWVRPRPAQVR
jgi:hypothetical protein